MNKGSPTNLSCSDDEVEDDGSQPKAEETDKIWRKYVPPRALCVLVLIES